MRKILSVLGMVVGLALASPAQACHPVVVPAVVAGSGVGAYALLPVVGLLALAAYNPDLYTPVFGKCNVYYEYPNGQGNMPRPAECYKTAAK